LWGRLEQVVMRARSYATESHEARQVRKEAAVSDPFRVPWECLVRANYSGNAYEDKSNWGARLLKYNKNRMNIVNHGYIHGFLFLIN
jgi:hypothetical protein